MHVNPPPGPPNSGPKGPSGPGLNPGFSRGIPDDEARLWALLAHASAIPLSVVGPALVYLYKKDESLFVAYHSVQAVYWALITVFVVVVFGVLTCGTGTVTLFFFWLASLYIGLRAKEGEWYGYWVIDSFGKNGTFSR